ncbi:MAG: hypothetical protein ACP5G1_01830 [Nanopusillaceae archaeon]
MIKKIKEFFIYIFFGEDKKSDLLFFLFIIFVYGIIYLIYPPLFSVIVTPSMEHKYFYPEKYLKYNITLQNFSTFPYPNGLYVGDVMIILPIDPKYINVGDVVLYKGMYKYKEDIFHRVVGINNNSFIIIGDNNPGPIVEEYENNMPPERILGVGILRIPFIGIIKTLI